MNNYLLPTGSSKLEKQLSNTFSVISEIPVPIRLLWNAEHCPVKLLPWLAWSLSVDDWDDAWCEQKKRSAILKSIYVHKYKGTCESINQIVEQRDLGKVLIDEGGAKKHNGRIQLRNSFHKRGNLSNWAEYQLIFLTDKITKRDAEQLLIDIQQYAPVRCFLRGIVKKRNLMLHNGYITTRNSEFKRGERWLIRQKIK